MKHLLPMLLMLVLFGCEKDQPDPQPEPFSLDNTLKVPKNVMMDFYHKRNTWPESTDELITFCQNHSDDYPENAVQHCSEITVKPLTDGNLLIETSINHPDFAAIKQVAAKNFDPNTLNSAKISTTLSPSGKFIGPPEGARPISEDPNNVRSIVEPISIKHIEK